MTDVLIFFTYCKYFFGIGIQCFENIIIRHTWRHSFSSFWNYFFSYHFMTFLKVFSGVFRICSVGERATVHTFWSWIFCCCWKYDVKHCIKKYFMFLTLFKGQGGWGGWYMEICGPPQFRSLHSICWAFVLLFE